MYRKSLLCLIAAGAFAIPACGDDDPPSGDDGANETGGSGGSTGGKGGSTGKGGSAGVDDGGEPGTGGKGGTDATGGKGGTGTAGDAGSGGGADAIPCEQGDPPQCADSSTILLCDPDADNTLQAFSCEEFCSTLGLEAGDCVADGADTTCECGDAVDEECFAGAEEVCSCLQGTEVECVTDADRFAWYTACVEAEAEEEVVRCFAAGSAQACSRTVAECVP